MVNANSDSMRRLDKVLCSLRQHQLWLATRERPEQEREGIRADFSGQDLSGLNLSDLDLTAAHLVWTNLADAALEGTCLCQADMRGAILDGADLRCADLQEAALGVAEGEKRMRPASLKGARLQDANLTGACLLNADLSACILDGANLRDATLDNANLVDASLQNCSLIETVFYDADLTNADLTGATGAQPSYFAGSVLKGAKVPLELATFDGLRTAEEMSKNSGKYFVAIMAACAYVLLTLLTSTDVGLFTDAATTTLPIVGLPINIVSFYLMTPLILLAAYVYFHLDLQRLWETLARLPAVFPDGRTLDEKAYPWLLGGLTRVYSARLRTPAFRRSHPKYLLGWQSFLSIALAWYSIPAILFFIWSQYLRRHDWNGTHWHIALILASMVLHWYFHGLMVWTLQHKCLERRVVRSFLWNKCLSSIRGVGFVVTTGFLLLCTQNLMRAIPPGDRDLQKVRLPEDAALPGSHPRKRIPHWFAKIGYTPFARLDYAYLATRPPNWTGTSEKPEDYQQIPSVLLQKKDFRYAHLNSAFLVHADLSDADLNGAQLTKADLRYCTLVRAQMSANLEGAQLDGVLASFAHFRGANLHNASLKKVTLDNADLSRADLTGAHLEGANLEYAHLKEALLQKTDLAEAHLKRAVLTAANLSGADLRQTDLTRANLEDAILENAILIGTKLTGAHLEGAHLEGGYLERGYLEGAYLERADLRHANLRRANLMEEHCKEALLNGADLEGAYLNEADLTAANLRGADLTGANLTGAYLNGTDLSMAKLTGANLDRTDLTGANLEGADLREVKSLTQEQLDSAITNQYTRVSLPLIIKPTEKKITRTRPYQSTRSRHRYRQTRKRAGRKTTEVERTLFSFHRFLRAVCGRRTPQGAYTLFQSVRDYRFAQTTSGSIYPVL